MKADKGYIFRGVSGWSIALFYGKTGPWGWSHGNAKFFHGYADWDVALTALKMFWREAPADQNGFPTGVAL
jgi:hypothetical protein